MWSPGGHCFSFSSNVLFLFINRIISNVYIRNVNKMSNILRRSAHAPGLRYKQHHSPRNTNAVMNWPFSRHAASLQKVPATVFPEVPRQNSSGARNPARSRDIPAAADESRYRIGSMSHAGGLRRLRRCDVTSWDQTGSFQSKSTKGKIKICVL